MGADRFDMYSKAAKSVLGIDMDFVVKRSSTRPKKFSVKQPNNQQGRTQRQSQHVQNTADNTWGKKHEQHQLAVPYQNPNSIAHGPHGQHQYRPPVNMVTQYNTYPMQQGNMPSAAINMNPVPDTRQL